MANLNPDAPTATSKNDSSESSSSSPKGSVEDDNFEDSSRDESEKELKNIFESIINYDDIHEKLTSSLSPSTPPQSILKPISKSPTDPPPPPPPILKKDHACNKNIPEQKPILKKRQSSEEFSAFPQDPKPILKKKSPESPKLKPILKVKTQPSETVFPISNAAETSEFGLKSILKKVATDPDSKRGSFVRTRTRSLDLDDPPVLRGDAVRTSPLGMRSPLRKSESSQGVFPPPPITLQKEPVIVGPSIAQRKSLMKTASQSSSQSSSIKTVVASCGAPKPGQEASLLLKSYPDTCINSVKPGITVKEAPSFLSSRASQNRTPSASFGPGSGSLRRIKSCEFLSSESFSSPAKRHFTLPVTAKEISAVPRNAEPVITYTASFSYTTTTLNPDLDDEHEDPLSTLSVGEKASLFNHLQKQQKMADTRPKGSGNGRFQNRHSPRHQTQPVTVDELKEAKKFFREQQNEDTNRDKSKAEASESKSDEDELSKLSISEKLRLFTQKIREETLPPKTSAPAEQPVVRPKRRRSSSSRFKTQPITSEELAGISPLAASMIRPPEPEALGGLSVQEVQARIFKHASEVLSSQDKKKGILKPASTSPVETRGILKHRSPSPQIPAKGILKQEPAHAPAKKPPKKLCEESSSSASSSDEDGDGDEDTSGPCKQILAGGQSHVVINKLPPAKSAALPPQLSHYRQVSAVQKKAVARAAQVKDEKKCSLESNGLDPGGALVRSQTQPLCPNQPLVESSFGGSIAQRLASLQKNNTESWKRRLDEMKMEKPKEVMHSTSGVLSLLKEMKPARTGNGVQRSSSIADRLSKLSESQEQWRSRVEAKDAVQFTVAGKMGAAVSSESPSAPPAPVKHTPRQVSFRRKRKEEAVVKHGVQVLPPLPLNKSKSMPNSSCLDSSSDSDVETKEEKPLPAGPKVEVPKVDDETFTSFFQSTTSSSKIEDETLEVSEDAFKLVTSQSHHQLLAQRKSVRTQVRRSATSRNPLRALASRTDLPQAYEEIQTGIAEQEMHRIKVEQLAKSSNMALSALAGLASTEDFKAVSLKRSGSSASTGSGPTQEIMLVQVKGRRHIQTRLVAPHISSVNQGDSYILVTPTQVVHWIGRYSNIIERAKGAELAQAIHTKKDLCYRGAGPLITLDLEKGASERVANENFYSVLKGTAEDCLPAGHPNEDEEYEAYIIATNMVYSVEKDELVPYQKCWGHIPSVEILQPEQVLVFDFGSELYVWQGKLSPQETRKTGVQLAKELWDQGYDYSECDINPLHPILGDKNQPLQASKRPEWAVFSKINQHMEPVLFREKFIDWPDLSRFIKLKRQDSQVNKAEGLPDLKPCDVAAMLSAVPEEPDMILEGSHVGRGVSYEDPSERKRFEVTTLGVRCWHILEYDHIAMATESNGQFHTGDTYVVQWRYVINQIGRSLTGEVSKHFSVGRERYAYFFWQGSESSITEKGASALMTVELDREMGPHVRVVQGKEPPCFLNLFKGRMVIYKGKREIESTNTPGPWKLFILQGELPNEACLVEVYRTCQNLRSRTSFVLLNVQTGTIYVWHGVKSAPHSRRTVMAAVNQITESQPPEMLFVDEMFDEFTIEEVEEGEEPKEFWEAMGGKNRHMYLSLLESNQNCEQSPRLFELSSVSGTFTASEVLCPYMTVDLPCPYPFMQADLYKASQPALFLVDGGDEVFVWQGWWPVAEGENAENGVAGSATVRWNLDRRLALETSQHYCQAKDPNNPPKSYLISAGLEPASFTNLFPEWVQRDNIAAINIKEGRNPGEMIPVGEMLARLTRTHYTREELTAGPALPPGVDPSRLESYLADSEFEEVFEMTKEEFYNLPTWKQGNLKKSLGFY